MNITNQIVIIDVSTANYVTIESLDNVNLDKFPIPHKGNRINIYNKEYKNEIYRVVEVTYAYKHTNSMHCYIGIYVRHV